MEALMSRSNWNIEVSVFVEGGKPKNPEKSPRSKVRTKRKLGEHEKGNKRIEDGSHKWEVSAYPLRPTMLSWHFTYASSVPKYRNPIL